MACKVTKNNQKAIKNKTKIDISKIKANFQKSSVLLYYNDFSS